MLLYRLIDRLLLISPEAVHGPLSLAGYLVCNYLLYLRVSGQFHMACGLLHLFGFQLPETHHQYLLASGFTDYWRRINIYWKDFMVRIVFNPVAFRLKRRPQPVALAAATVVVFVVTWLLHAYQIVLAAGRLGLQRARRLFWGILGLLVLFNVQLDCAAEPEKNRGPVPVTTGAWRSARPGSSAHSSTIALLWSLWNSPNVGAWMALCARGLGF